MRSKVKPKPCLPAGRRPARKHNTISYRKWIETVNQANQWHDELRVYKAESFQKDCKIEGQRRALETAEADKRTLLDQNLQLTNDYRALEIKIRNFMTMIKCDNLKEEKENWNQRSNTMLVELRAERDALAKRNQELEAQLLKEVNVFKGEIKRLASEYHRHAPLHEKIYKWVSEQPSFGGLLRKWGAKP